MIDYLRLRIQEDLLEEAKDFYVRYKKYDKIVFNKMNQRTMDEFTWWVDQQDKRFEIKDFDDHVVIEL